MSVQLPSKLAGSVRWAIAPYTPAPPFRIYAAGRDPYQFDDAEQLITASSRVGDAEFTYLIPAKTRPVLILTDPERSEWQEVLTLRLRRFSTIRDPQQQKRIRQSEEPLYFHLEPTRFKLPEENAILVPALAPINIGAISSGEPLGVLNANEMGDVGERLIRHFDLDIRSLIERRIHELARQRRQS